MTKIATIEVIVPDEAKTDDVFNYMRRNECHMELKDLQPNPKDPPAIKVESIMKIWYSYKGAEEAAEIENNIRNAILSVKGVQSCATTQIACL